MTITRSTTFPHIVRNPQILGGEPVVDGTRISVRTIVNLAKMYDNISEVCAAFPWVSRTAIEEALAFYEANREEIDRYIAENRLDAE